MARTFTVQNSGDDVLTSVAATVSGNAAFSLSSTPAATVSAGGTTTFTVTFAPSAVGVVTATVSIANNDSDENPYTFVIGGTGVAPEIDVRGNSVAIANGDSTPSSSDHTDFGSANANSGSVVRTFTIQNIGGAALTSINASLSGNAAFSLSSTPAATVSAGGTSTFQVTFAPTVGGTVTATVSIANNDNDENPYTFVIGGTGLVPEINVTGNGSAIPDGDTTPSAADQTSVGSVAPGASLVRTFAIFNIGTADLTGIAASVSGAAAFSISSIPSATVGSGNSTTVAVTFAPSAPGSVTATVTIASNDSDENPYTFVVRGATTEAAPLFGMAWGTNGSQPGQFNYPFGIASDGSDNLYVADYNNHRIQKFDSSGAFLTAWGTNGSAAGEFNNPIGVATDSSGNVYVVDYGNNRIQKFDSSGTYLTEWGSLGSNPGQFTNPIGIATDSNGNVYVADTFNHRIQKFNSSGVFLTEWGTYGTGPGQFDYPYGMATDSSGNLYIADFNNNRIQKFDSNGVFLTEWGAWGNEPGQFSYPNAVAIDSRDHLYVVDWNNQRIQKFDSNGDYLTEWGSGGNDLGQFTNPNGVAIDSNDNVYVVDTDNSRVQKFGFPEIEVRGNGVSVANGDSTPSTSDHTDFGSANANSGTVTRTFTIQNSGAATLSAVAATVSGDAAFTLSSTPMATVSAGGSITFAVTFAPSAVGVVTATVSIANSDSDENPYTFVIGGTGVNNAPTASNGNATTAEDTAKTITLVANDENGDSLSYTIVSQPVSGTVTLIGNTATYTPTANYNGSDSFTFKANDSTTDSNVATVSVTVTAVNDAPTATNSSATTNEDTPKTLTLSANDVDGDSLSYTIVSQPLSGTVTVVGSTAIYTPTDDFNGSDSFTFKANDGQADSNVATIQLTVAAVNDAPLADDQSVSTEEDTPLAITLTGSDVEGDSLTYSLVSQPLSGTVTLVGNTATYTPTANYNGSDSFTFQVNDGVANSTVATVAIIVGVVNDAPVADDQSVTTDEDTAVSVTLTASDTEDDALTYTVVGSADNGSVTLVGDTATFTPTANFNGQASFTFKASDGVDDSNVATVTITVSAVNDAPVATAGSATTAEGTPVNLTLAANDSEGDALTYTVVDAPSDGVVTLVGNTATYTPTGDFNGSDSFTFQASDGDADSNVATVSLTVTPVNDAPVANNGSATTQEDTTKTITLSADDVDGDSLSYTIVSQPLSGTVTLVGNTATYTPTANDNGSDSFTFQANDGTTDSNVATIQLTVGAVNDAPLADDQSVSTAEDTPLAITLTGSDVEGDSLTYSLVSQPLSGTVTLVGNTATYTPTANYNGSDSFTFQVNDGAADSTAATVDITVGAVNDAPVADDQSVTTDEETPVSVTLTASDTEDDALTYTVVGSASHGVVTLMGATATFTPTTDFNGQGSFTFQANDGVDDSNVATVTVTVDAVNDAPVATAGSATTDEGTPVNITLAANDIDGDALTYTVVDAPSDGIVTLVGNTATYTPTGDFNGSDSFTFQANDGSVDSNVATVSVTVTAVNDAPTANDGSATTNEDTAKTITLVANDVEGDSLSYAIAAQPSHGTVTVVGNTATYTPTANYNGSDSFTFQANDGAVDSNVATVSLTVTAVNDAPVADNGSATTNEDTAKTITLSANDGEGDSLSYTIVSQPLSGTVTVVGNTATYTPTANYNGSDSFTFQADDGDADSNVATVSLTVTPVNDAPTANNDNATTAEDTPQSITLAADDVDGDALSYTIVSQPLSGTVTVVGNTATYTPTSNFNGSDNFTFQANDGAADSNVATVQLTVSAVNDAPLADDQSVSTAEDTPLTITLTGSDVEGDSLSYTIVSQPLSGTVTLVGNTATYTPTANYNGSDSFTFKVNDGAVDSTVATVAITVGAVNDAPVADDQSITTDEETAVNVTLTASDIEGDTLTYSLVGSASNGSVTLVGDTATFTPTADFNGQGSFTFQANDGVDDSTVATVTVTVSAVNDAPVADNGSGATDEGTPVTITLAANDSEGDALTYTLVDTPSEGVVTLVGNTATYTPTGDFHGSDSFTFQASDGAADSNVATVNLTVNNVNDAPVADNGSATTDEDTAKTITLSANDVDGDSLSYTIISQPLSGTVTLVGNTATYTPTANYSGSDSFTFQANDGVADANIATVSLTITPVNDAPTASDSAANADDATATAITLTADDMDGDALTYAIVSQPSNGSVTVSGNTATYTATANFSGTVSFTFQANDGLANSNVATVTVTVRNRNDAPVATDSAVTTNEDAQKSITLTASDADGDGLGYMIVGNPANGTVQVSGNTATYTPTANFNGSDSFTFKANDGAADSNIATVAVTVRPVNDRPIVVSERITMPEDSVNVVIAVLANDSDADGDSLGLARAGIPSRGGMVSIQGSTLLYNPVANFNGTETFTYTVSDGRNGSASGRVTAVVTAVNDAPETVVTATVSGGSASFAFSAVDVDSTVFTYQCALDGAAFATCTSPKSYSNLGFGAHNFQVRARDNRLLVDPTPATHSWSVAAATLTIVLDVQPDSERNRLFTSPHLPSFYLDDTTIISDTDAYTNTKRFTVLPGSYTITEAAAAGWHLRDILCSPGANATINNATRTVALTVAGGDQVTCTFTEQRGGAVVVRSFADLNGNGLKAAREPYTNGVTLRLYSAPGTVDASQTTGTLLQDGKLYPGHTRFYNVRPGLYALCVVPPAGWVATRPATIMAEYDNLPCFAPITVAPAQDVGILIGNKPATLAAAAMTDVAITDDATADDPAAEAELAQLLTEEAETPSEADAPDSEEVFGPHPLFLPLIRIATAGGVAADAVTNVDAAGKPTEDEAADALLPAESATETTAIVMVSEPTDESLVGEEVSNAAPAEAAKEEPVVTEAPLLRLFLPVVRR